MDITLILLLALAFDLTLGEPHRVMHPVVWMGKVISSLERGVGSQSPAARFLYGLGMVIFTTGLFAASAYFILVYLESLNLVLYVVVGALIFKTTFSIKELQRTALGIKRLLIEDKLDEARFELRSLVSRDTRDLPEPRLVSATVESVAESMCDSFVAPLFYFLLLGVPGAIAYRVVNTMDSMIGYHGRYEYLGKFASRLDDVVNFIPARLTALLLVLAAFLSGKEGKRSWQVALSEHSKTESPNSGWPIAAAAGALDVQLEKVGYYKLGEPHKPLAPETIDASLTLAQAAMLVWISICLITGGIHFAITS